MYLMYVDESGDVGMVNSPTRYFVLTGLVVHELRWQNYLDQLIAFRRRMRVSFGLRLRDEIHASAFINRPGALVRIPKNERLTILRMLADELAQMTDLNVINVIVTVLFSVNTEMSAIFTQIKHVLFGNCFTENGLLARSAISSGEIGLTNLRSANASNCNEGS